MSEADFGEPGPEAKAGWRADDRREHPAFFTPVKFDPEKVDVRLTIGPKEISSERSARIRIEEEDARHRRWKEKVTHLFLAAALSVTGLACLAGAFLSPSPETRQFAAAGLSAILTGTVGYFTGKAAR